MGVVGSIRSRPTSRRKFLLGVAASTGLVAAHARQAFANEGVSDEVRALTRAYNWSGHRLLGELAIGSGNIAFSPYSIGSAMAMAMAGARGATQAELTKTLMHSLSRIQIASASEEATAALLAYDSSSSPRLCPEGMTWKGDDCQGPSEKGACRHGVLHGGALTSECVIGPIIPFVRLSIANALVLNKELGELVSADYRGLARDRFAAEVFTDASLAQINDWVRGKTDGKIDKILDRLDKLSVAVLLNALYLRVAWERPFHKSQTANRDFNLSKNSRIQTSTMMRVSGDPVVRSPSFRAIRLPLADPSLGMIVVLPNEIDGLTEVSRNLDATQQAALLDAFDGKEPSSAALTLEATGEAPISLPKFRVAFATDLVPPFRDLGLKLALSDDADFSGMTGGRGKVEIRQIRHRAVVEVAEDGVEAAAATAVEMVRTAGLFVPSHPREPFIADRPFLFLLTDRVTSAVLFEGRIVDPTKSA